MFVTLIICTLFVSVICTNNVIFDVNEIECVNTPHKYDKYYTPSCVQWKKELSQHFNKVTCIIADSNQHGELYSGCSPAYGDTRDSIAVYYQLSKNCENNETCNKQKYKLIANVQLNRPIHPFWNFILIIAIAGLWFILANSKCKDRGIPMLFYMGGHQNIRQSRIHWNKIK